MHIDKHPVRSYWEREWTFPATDGVVGITLRGGESGPNADAKVLPSFASSVRIYSEKLQPEIGVWIRLRYRSDHTFPRRVSGDARPRLRR
jgi:hypothetical protein